MQSRQGRFPRTLTGLHRCVGGLGPALLWGSNLYVDHLHNQLLIPIHAVPETLLVQVLELLDQTITVETGAPGQGQGLVSTGVTQIEAHVGGTALCRILMSSLTAATAAGLAPPTC